VYTLTDTEALQIYALRLLKDDTLVSNRAVFDTGSAARAKVHIDAAGPFPDLNLEISRGTLNRFHISIGNDLDV
jgi:hypothetical protein